MHGHAIVAIIYLSCSRHVCTIHIADGLFLIHTVYIIIFAIAILLAQLFFTQAPLFHACIRNMHAGWD